MALQQSVRLDKWLWAVRLYKTRSLAGKACSAGQIKCGSSGRVLKSSTAVAVGDRLVVPALDGSHRRHLEVVQLIERRVGAALAVQAYKDHTTAEVLEEVEKRRALLKAERALRKEGDQGRMTKKNRREWERRERQSAGGGDED